MAAAVLKYLPAQPSDDACRAGDHLSPRERDVLFHLAKGQADKVIARNLGIAEATVKIHLKNLRRKIKVHNRTQAAVWAMRHLPGLCGKSCGSV